MKHHLVTLLLSLCISQYSLGETQSDTAFIDQLQPAPVDGGFKMEGYWVWGMSVIEGEDGLFHGYAARWPKSVPFAPNWVTNSEIVHATAKKPEGPYEFQSVVFERREDSAWDGKMTHNPTIHKSGDTYLLFYIGTHYDFDVPTKRISKAQRGEARANQRIGLATSKSPWGPWERPDKPILEPRSDEWDALMTVNPAVCVKPDGSILLVYKSTSGTSKLLKVGVAGATSYNAPFERLRNEPIFEFDNSDGVKRHVEDPYIWWNGSHYELIMKDMGGNICGEKGGGIHATSSNGIDWTISEQPLAYSRNVTWDDGQTIKQGSFERPQLLIKNGVPTHLFAATADGPGGFHKADNTWNMCIPLSNSAETQPKN